MKTKVMEKTDSKLDPNQWELNDIQMAEDKLECSELEAPKISNSDSLSSASMITPKVTYQRRPSF
jgi:hypothetical protein